MLFNKWGECFNSLNLFGNQGLENSCNYNREKWLLLNGTVNCSGLADCPVINFFSFDFFCVFLFRFFFNGFEMVIRRFERSHHIQFYH